MRILAGVLWVAAAMSAVTAVSAVVAYSHADAVTRMRLSEETTLYGVLTVVFTVAAAWVVTLLRKPK